MAMSKNEMKDLTDRKEKQEAEGCSESVASYMMESPVWEHQFMQECPTLALCDGFFFDHEYMSKCNTAN